MPETSAAHARDSEPVPPKDAGLEAGAALTQSFKPLSSICAHLNAFHLYASEPTRCVEANHYCAHVSKDVRQCLVYDSDQASARLIGVEYMATPEVYEGLPAEERRLWHSHVYEVKSGMLIMPTPAMLPRSAWEVAETKEMEQVVGLYGKTYHLWQVDRGDAVPLGEPQLMLSFTGDEDAKIAQGKWADRDERYNVDTATKARARAHVEEPQIHPDADDMRKRTGK